MFIEKYFFCDFVRLAFARVPKINILENIPYLEMKNVYSCARIKGRAIKRGHPSSNLFSHPSIFSDKNLSTVQFFPKNYSALKNIKNYRPS